MKNVVEFLAFLIRHSKAFSKTIFWVSGIILAIIGAIEGFGELYHILAPPFLCLMGASVLFLMAEEIGMWLFDLRFYYYGFNIPQMEQKRPWRYIKLKEILSLSRTQRQEMRLGRARRFCLYRYLKWYRKYVNNRRKENTLI